MLFDKPQIPDFFNNLAKVLILKKVHSEDDGDRGVW
jgi:hypothetical protein